MGLLSGLFGRREDPPGTQYEIRPADRPGRRHALWRIAPGQPDKRVITSDNLSEINWYRQEYDAGRRPGYMPDTRQWRIEHGINPDE